MESIWSKEIAIQNRKPLPPNLTVDALVIGAGMAGINISYLLQNSGLKVAVLDAAGIADGETKNTTAKITSQHRLIYDKLIRQMGVGQARQYALANTQAIESYANIIQKESIPCDFERLPSYVYTLIHEEALQKEVEACKRLGIDAELVKTVGLPFEVKAALRFDNQAQFNPLSYIRHLSQSLEVYENTLVKGIAKNIVHTSWGEVKADHIVIATHYPFINLNGLYFVRLCQERSYVLALENAGNVGGMYIDEAQDGLSFRNYKDYLLLGGCGHRTGTPYRKGDSTYGRLRKEAGTLFPHCKEVAHWSAQDVITLDGVPCIGKLTSRTPNLYVAVGFNKWGMTSSMAAAEIIKDAILNRHNSYSNVFRPQRLYLKASTKQLMVNLAHTTKGQLDNLKPVSFKTSKRKQLLKRIKPGEAKIVKLDGKKLGIYRENTDNQKRDVLHAVIPKCTHMGCGLHWNKDELSWDCACHGSRFDYKGKLINNPAMRDITFPSDH